MDNYSQRLVEVNEILNHLSKENYKKIPLELLELINKNMDSNYSWKYNENKALEEQNLPRDTFVILSYLNYEYLSTDKQKKKLDIIHENNEKIKQDELLKKYDPNKLFKNTNQSEKNNKQNNCLITQNEHITIFDRIKNLFNKIIHHT